LATRLLSYDGQWVPVEEAYATGEYAAVYNLRLADFHTYFVGSEDWGFSVWAHNANCWNDFQSKNKGKFSSSTEAAAVWADQKTIKTTPADLQHALDRHTYSGISKYAGKSKFNPGEDISGLINAGNGVAPTLQSNGKFARREGPTGTSSFFSVLRDRWIGGLFGRMR
jgi:hypothetical protein